MLTGAPVEVHAEAVGDGLAGHGGRSLADDEDLADLLRLEVLYEGLRQDVRPEVEVDLLFPVLLLPDAVLAAQGLADRLGRLGDLLEKEVGEGAPVDVAGGDLGLLDHGLREPHGMPVVAERPDAGKPARRVLVEDEDLPGGLGVLGVAGPLAVHLDEARRALHEAVELRGKEVLVLAQAHEEGLSAALEGEVDLSRLHVAGQRDGVGALEVIHGQPEGLLEGLARQEVALDLQGDDFRVRGDLGGDLVAVGRLEERAQHLVVVDVAVEDDADRPAARPVGRVELHPGDDLIGERRSDRRGDRAQARRRDLPVGALRAEGVAADGVAVLLGDGAHGGPAGVGEGRLRDRGLAGEGAEDAIRADCLAELADVLAELADDGGRLVDEREVDAAVGVAVVGHMDGPVQKVALDGAPAEVVVKPLAPDLFDDAAQGFAVFQRERELDSRRVPSPDLEPVDAVEQEVDPGVFDEALRGDLLDAVGAGQVQDLFDVGEDVLLEAPEDVLQEDETAVDDLHLRRGKASGLGLEQALLPGQKCRHLGNEGLKGRCLAGIEEKGLEMGFLPQEHEVPLHLLERANACEVPLGLDLARDHPRERGLADCGEMLCEVGAGVDCKGLRTFLDGQDAGDAAAQERGVHREENDREGQGPDGGCGRERDAIAGETR